jgi:hypothetical protein
MFGDEAVTTKSLTIRVDHAPIRMYCVNTEHEAHQIRPRHSLPIHA